jgi:hypothetical protein
MPKFIRIATVLHVDTSNSEIFFQYVQILTFLKNSPSNLKFSYILRLSPLCMSIGKWQKPWEIKLLLRVILEQCGFEATEFDAKRISFLFLTEEAWSHGGLRTRELGQTSDRPNVRLGRTVWPNFYCAVRPKWQNFFLQNTELFLRQPFIFLFCLMTHMYAALSLVYR